MANTLGSLTVDLAANITRFERALDRAEYLARRKSKAIAGALRSVQIGLASLGAGFSLSQTIGAFADFEKRLVNVGKTANLEGKELDLLGKNIQGLARTLPISTARLQELASVAGQLGVQGGGDILKFTKTLGQLELATDIAGEEGAKSILRLLNVTGEGVDGLEQFGNVITRLGNNSAASEREILGVAQRVAEQTAQFKLASEEVLALSAALASVGQRAEGAGTAIGDVLNAMAKAAKDGGEELKLFADVSGLTIEEFRKLRQEAPIEAIDRFTAGLGELNDIGQLGVLEKLSLDGKRVRGVLTSLAGATGILTDSLKLTADELANNDALFKEVVKQADTFSSKMQVLGNVANEAAVALGDIVAPAALTAIKGFQEALVTLVENVDKLVAGLKIAAGILASRYIAQTVYAIQTQNELTKAIIRGKAASAAAAGTTLKAAVAYNAIAVAQKRVTIGMAAATLGMRAWTSALAFFGGPIGASITALAGLIAYVAMKTSEAAETTKRYNDAMSDNADVVALVVNNIDALSEAKKEDIRITLMATEMTQRLALAEAQLELGRQQRDRGRNKNTARLRALEQTVSDLESAVFDTASAITDLDMSLNNAGESAKSTTNNLNDLTSGVKALTPWAQDAANALDAISAQFDALDAAQARKDAGLDDEAFNIKLKLRAELDSEDATRELQRQIDEWQSVLDRIDTGDLVGFSEQEIDLIRERILSLHGDVDEALDDLSETGKKSSDVLADAFSQAGDRMARSISDSIAAATLNLESFQDLANSILRQIASQIIQATIVSPAIGAIPLPGLGGTAEKGGPVMGGKTYLVGERGPELLQLGGTRKLDIDSITNKSVMNIDKARNIGSTTVNNAMAAADALGLEKREKGGPVVGGKTYLVGERGPEFITMPQGKSGYVTPANITERIINQQKQTNRMQSVFKSIEQRAAGGPVSAGETYLVGEKGPELLVMGSKSGFVSPSQKKSNDGGTVVNITNNTNAEAKVQRSNGPSGREIVDIVIGEVNANIAGGGSIARTLQNSFTGFNRRSIART